MSKLTFGVIGTSKKADEQRVPIHPEHLPRLSDVNEGAMNDYRISMVNPQGQILDEIAEPKSTRDTIALTYAFCIRQRAEVDFGTVNRAILSRWSPSGLEYIKRKAWKQFEPRRDL